MIARPTQNNTKNPRKLLYSLRGSKYDTRDSYSTVGNSRRCCLSVLRAAEVAFTDGGASSGGAGVLGPLGTGAPSLSSPCNARARLGFLFAGRRARGWAISVPSILLPGLMTWPFPLLGAAPAVVDIVSELSLGSTSDMDCICLGGDRERAVHNMSSVMSLRCRVCSLLQCLQSQTTLVRWEGSCVSGLKMDDRRLSGPKAPVHAWPHGSTETCGSASLLLSHVDFYASARLCLFAIQERMRPGDPGIRDCHPAKGTTNTPIREGTVTRCSCRYVLPSSMRRARQISWVDRTRPKLYTNWTLFLHMRRI